MRQSRNKVRRPVELWIRKMSQLFIQYFSFCGYVTFNSRWMPNFSMRFRSVARVMPSSFAA